LLTIRASPCRVAPHPGGCQKRAIKLPAKKMTGVSNMENDKKQTPKTANKIALGVGPGLAVGVAIGTALHNIALGIAIGLMIGLAIGMIWQKASRP